MIVELDKDLFREIYPNFSETSDEVLEYWWEVACTIIDNTDDSPIPYEPPSRNDRKSILYALLCHLCVLAQRGPDNIGMVTGASEGSVSISMTSTLSQLKNGAWWNQTQCGATAFELMKPYAIGGFYFNGGPKY